MPFSASASTTLPRWLEQFEAPLAQVQHTLEGLTPPVSAPLKQAITHALGTQGKLIRPSLSLSVATCLHPGSLPQALIEVACVSELIHVATLLHDDVLDESDQRRGEATVRATLGNPTAILGGDWLLAKASQVLARLGNVQLVALFAEVLCQLCDGESEQHRCAFSVEASNWASYQRKTRGKTASLFAAATQAPALWLQCEPSTVQALATYGHEFGMAFQLVDDLLDYEADASDLGKPVLDDLRNGLINAPVLLGLEHPELGPTLASNLERLFTLLQDPAPAAEAEAVEALIQQLKSQLQAANALEQTRALAREHLAKAQAAVESLSAVDTQPLSSLLELMAERTY